jgi:hypothetical protein
MKADKLDFLANKSLSELKALAAELKLEPNGDRRLKSTWFDLSIEYRCPGIKKRAAKLRDLARAERLRVLLEEERHSTIAIGENSPGADLVQEPIEKSLDVDRARWSLSSYRPEIPPVSFAPWSLSSYLPKNSPVSHAPWSLSKNPPMSRSPIRRSNSPRWNLHSHSKCATPGAKSETAGTCPIAI